MARPRAHRSGFVPVELIAIVLCLSALGVVLVISARGPRQEAMRINCVSNLKQHAIGVENDARQRYEGAGPYYQVRKDRHGANFLTKRIDEGQQGAVYGASFWITNAGNRGRDLK